MIRAAPPIGGATPPVVGYCGCGNGTGLTIGESGPGMNGRSGIGTQPSGPGWKSSGKLPGEIAGSVCRPIASFSASWNASDSDQRAKLAPPVRPKNPRQGRGPASTLVGINASACA